MRTLTPHGKGRSNMSTFVETILGGKAGTVATVQPDYIMINDGPAHAAVDSISTVASPEKILVIYDHDVPSGRPEAAAILRKNLEFAKKYGCRYIQAKGIGYQYLCEEVIKPGQIIVGGGSHGGVYGARGALGIDVSVPELVRLVETGRYRTIVPETVYVNVTGELKDGVSITDAALAFLKEKTDIQKRAIEFYAPDLDLHQKDVLCSMAAITGAYTASMTDQKPIGGYELNLSAVVPMVMMPCKDRKDQKNAVILAKSEIAGMELQAGQIGGVTGGTIEELRKAAALIRGKKLALGFRLTVCPATSRDYIDACNEGILTSFIDFGAQISAAGDHSVVIQGPGALGPGEAMITTGLHTFAGAMGVESSRVYTASTESVIASAVIKQV